MDAHRVHVLDGADDHGVTRLVAHHFHLEFLPADERLLDKDLVVERRLESARDDFAELVRVVRDSTARSAEREAGTDDERPCADFICNRFGLFGRVGASGLWHVESELFHRVLEEIAVFRAGNCVRIRADHLDAAFFEDAGALHLHREVERCLSAERGEKRVRLFLPDDRGHRIHGERLDVCRLGHLGIGHHRRGVGVHEDDFVSLPAEGLHGLASGVVELASLSDDDRTRSDDHYLLQICALHFVFPLSAAVTSPRNSGCGAVGRDLNSGWNWQAMK